MSGDRFNPAIIYFRNRNTKYKNHKDQLNKVSSKINRTRELDYQNDQKRCGVNIKEIIKYDNISQDTNLENMLLLILLSKRRRINI